MTVNNLRFGILGFHGGKMRSAEFYRRNLLDEGHWEGFQSTVPFYSKYVFVCPDEDSISGNQTTWRHNVYLFCRSVGRPGDNYVV